MGYRSYLGPLAGVPVRGAGSFGAGLLGVGPGARLAVIVILHLVAAVAPQHAGHAAGLQALAARCRAGPPGRREPLALSSLAGRRLGGAGTRVRRPQPSLAPRLGPGFNSHRRPRPRRTNHRPRLHARPTLSRALQFQLTYQINKKVKKKIFCL